MDQVYLRYYVGHKGRFGHEFLEFELRPDGLLRYSNNSNYKRDTLIRKELRISPIVMDQVSAILKDAKLMSLDDRAWPLPDKSGKQELEVVMGKEHILFCTSKIASVVEIQGTADPEGLRAFHYLVQDLKSLVLALIASHFKIKPI